ncbi:hypothetical protein EJ05DRAFT_489718 [Pseudovirgaria hyperparasitica]|uniref:Uncharacterized protein n=1 Tax=Pseudovirgaria hyperparasitica TaxID=470096 RepID=A0A6A6VWJ2_9PEZI|nr:uncharacterized protein EJ05DRAFT_489718 [Pseudovirgaria hyperparasitica]KAF2754010.1 hypothetical protein EJ05DRAFT_489718 [Pseudovirgaria hyperparasitica]
MEVASPLAALVENSLTRINRLLPLTCDMATNTTAGPLGLPSHHWESTKSVPSIDEFVRLHNLTIVTAETQDAALMRSWTRDIFTFALLIILLCCALCSALLRDKFASIYERLRTKPSESEQPLKSAAYLGVLASATILFLPMWIATFAISTNRGAAGGWISVSGFTVLFHLAVEVHRIFAILGVVSWVLSLVYIVGRWKGVTAYLVTNLNGCKYHDGLDFLQTGRRTADFRIFSTVAFVLATLVALWGLFPCDRDRKLGWLLLPLVFAIFCYDCYVANAGTPLVVSGNCLLVEESPALGFMDSGVRLSWKVLSFFA